MRYSEEIEPEKTVKEIALIAVKIIRFILNKILSLVRWILYLINSVGVLILAALFRLDYISDIQS